MKEKIRNWLQRIMQFRIIIPVKRLLFGVLIAATIFGAVMGVRAFWKSEIPLVYRDLAVAIVAHIKAGDKVPFEADVVSYFYLPNDTWGVYTNSKYLIDWAMKISAFFSYEKVTNIENVPQAMMIVPLSGDSSFHLLGQASCSYQMVRYNIRILQDERWNDERMMLSVMVHEMIHLQLGNYCRGTTQEREAHTQAATLEVLAAMCNYGEELACKAFWDELEDFARSSLRVRLRSFGFSDDIYGFISNILWRDANEERVARKAGRFWNDNPAELMRIVKDYGQYPYEQYVIPGIRGRPMNTGKTAGCICEGPTTVLGMPFDDTFDVLGLLRVFFFIR